jgi:hypothetical protein
MDDPLRIDLEGARDLGVAVELHLTTGEKLLTGLHHWPDESDGSWFSVYAPQSFGDDTTTRKIFRDQVSHWIVTNAKY